MEMTANPETLEFPHSLRWLKPGWLRPFHLHQMGGWPWFGSAAIDDNLMPWGRTALGQRPAKGPSAMPPPDAPNPDRTFHHIPVLLDEVLAALQPAPGKLILDGTLGGGGHAEALLQLGARVVGMDQDPAALRHASHRLAPYGDQFCALQGNFRDFPDILAEAGVSGLDGILVDLGVSSHQLDTPERGFSFQKDGPLDLRMNPEAGRPASELLHHASAEELERIFREYGEEPRARQIAEAISKERAARPIRRTSELADLICRCVPGRGKRHPATLVFQALRIAVNDELGALKEFLESAPKWLKPGGKLAIITFHSLEDRVVKQTLHQMAAPFIDRPEWPAPQANPAYYFKLHSRKSTEPSAQESRNNPRARSARLRSAERLPQDHE